MSPRRNPKAVPVAPFVQRAHPPCPVCGGPLYCTTMHGLGCVTCGRCVDLLWVDSRGPVPVSEDLRVMAITDYDRAKVASPAVALEYERLSRALGTSEIVGLARAAAMRATARRLGE